MAPDERAGPGLEVVVLAGNHVHPAEIGAATGHHDPRAVGRPGGLGLSQAVGDRREPVPAGTVEVHDVHVGKRLEVDGAIADVSDLLVVP